MTTTHIRAAVMIFALAIVIASCGGDETKVFVDIEFTLRVPECRNSGTVEAGGVSWGAVGDAPAEWRGRAVEGDLSVSGGRGMFTDAEGETMGMTTGFRTLACSPWPDE